MSETDDEVRVHLVPSVSGGLLLRDVVTSHTSLKGAADAILHPLIDAFLRELPIEHREMFRFDCAEATLVSNRLIEFEDSRGTGPLSWPEAVEYCSGGTVFLSRVQDPTDPEHGAVAAPCKSCTRLLAALGIEVLAS